MEKAIFSAVYFEENETDLKDCELHPFVHVFWNFINPITLMWENLSEEDKHEIIDIIKHIKKQYLLNSTFREIYIFMYKSWILQVKEYLAKLPEFIDKERYNKIICLSNQIENELKKCLEG